MIDALHWFAAVLILAEALNKLERTHVRGFMDLPWKRRAELVMKLAAWSCMAIGSMGIVAQPLVPMPWPGLADALVVLGLALLLLRTRVTENLFREERAAR